MLIAALIVYLSSLVGGSSNIFLGEWLIKESKSQFKQAIQEKERSKQVMKALDEMIKEAKKFNEEASKGEKKLGKLVKDYHSSREDFQKVFARVQTEREGATGRVLDRFPELKKNIPREEWGKTFEKGRGR
jgi:hypothetical protein